MGILYRQAGPDDLDEWLNCCEDAFSAKGTPRSYFKDHWDLDPFKNINGVFIAVDEAPYDMIDNIVRPCLRLKEEIDSSTTEVLSSTLRVVGSVRVFHREIYYNGEILPMGGIGRKRHHTNLITQETLYPLAL